MTKILSLITLSLSLCLSLCLLSMLLSHCLLSMSFCLLFLVCLHCFSSSLCLPGSSAASRGIAGDEQRPTLEESGTCCSRPFNWQDQVVTFSGPLVKVSTFFLLSLSPLAPPSLLFSISTPPCVDSIRLRVYGDVLNRHTEAL